MRDILFRGKRADNGDWHEGEDIMRNTIRGKVCLAKIGGDWISVDPETVGQYTGLKDKNGKKIFEGDTVWFGNEKERGVVYFDNSCSRFAVRFDTFDAAFDHLYSNELEIIGNVHDNPELTEGGE